MPDPTNFLDFIAKTIREVEIGVAAKDYGRAGKANFALYGVGKRFDKEQTRGNPIAVHYSGEISNIIHYLEEAYMPRYSTDNPQKQIASARKELQLIRRHYRENYG